MHDKLYSMDESHMHRRILPVLVLAQLAGTAPWFAVNALMPDLQQNFGWPATAVGGLTSALQFGFILGTLVFAVLAVADRFSARRVFLLCALAQGLCCLGAWAMVEDRLALLVWRFATGICLAGIYPVGMKIAAQWFPRGLGPALGYLVGALVLGSASGHALRAMGQTLPWSSVMLWIAAIGAGSGVLLYFGVPEHATSRGRLNTLQWQALTTLVRDPRVRSSVLGYFGHMWELYTLWVLMPAIVATRLQGSALSWVTFVVLGAGAVGCFWGARMAPQRGSAWVACVLLAVSGLCGLLAPWLLHAPDDVFYAWLLVWGISVSGDSPQFSALTARNAPQQAVGSVLTLTNSIGFAISIASILLFVEISKSIPLDALLPALAIGPALGLWAMRPLWRERA